MIQRNLVSFKARRCLDELPAILHTMVSPESGASAMDVTYFYF
ncbi:MAG TPA: hypothetical protein VFG29_01545 [Syntrophales bacterium]|nr:hypothetical protein [Syntrophales bacterium]